MKNNNLPNDWIWKTLEEVQAKNCKAIVSGPFGSNISKKFFVSSGVPVIRGNNLTTDMTKYIDNGYVFVTKEKAEELSGCHAIPGDLVFTAAGTLGQVGIIPHDSEYPLYIISNKQMRARIDNEIVDRDFVFYWLSSPAMVRYVQQRNTGSSVPLINLSILRNMPIPLPPTLIEQRAIAGILRLLDDKIEINRKMNETLEEMARAIFKSWFVDFDPVRAKAEGRKPYGMDSATASLFPDRFEDSSLGKIPKGWKTGVLNDMYDFVIGGDWGKDDVREDFTNPVHSIRGADIPSLQTSGVGKMPVRFLKDSSFKKRTLEDGDIVLEISGGSPTQCTGRVVRVSAKLLDRLQYPLSCSNFCRLIKPKSNGLSLYIYFWLQWLYHTDQLFQYETGTTGIKNFGFKTFSETHEVALPPTYILKQFVGIVSGMMDMSQHNGSQSDTLSEIRDTLLPKLMSGEIRIKDAEKFVEGIR